MLPEGEAGFFCRPVRIRPDCDEKFLDLQLGLLVARRDDLPRLDVIEHIPLHQLRIPKIQLTSMESRDPFCFVETHAEAGSFARLKNLKMIRSGGHHGARQK